ncbi:hypothetical protein RRG08_017454 [Elysia crispata]|uniref:Uncharacterized protein n=1 Tax=Elysia crispata TaxID=231223 RepID=A0AAE1DE97_9GAST|nr:hypothetical protein RRG08_017454 [Elysia crispata]
MKFARSRLPFPAPVNYERQAIQSINNTEEDQTRDVKLRPVDVVLFSGLNVCVGCCRAMLEQCLRNVNVLEQCLRNVYVVEQCAGAMFANVYVVEQCAGAMFAECSKCAGYNVWRNVCAVEQQCAGAMFAECVCCTAMCWSNVCETGMLYSNKVLEQCLQECKLNSNAGTSGYLQNTSLWCEPNYVFINRVILQATVIVLEMLNFKAFGALAVAWLVYIS